MDDNFYLYMHDLYVCLFTFYPVVCLFLILCLSHLLNCFTNFAVLSSFHVLKDSFQVLSLIKITQ